MLLTEEEAKSKRCPVRVHTKVLAENAISYAPTVAVATNDKVPCLATGCMAWRWKPGENKELGYCGLAGPSEVKA